MRGAGLWNIWVQGVQILNKCAGAFRQISGIVCKDNIGCDIAVFNRSAYNSFFWTSVAADCGIIPTPMPISTK